MNRRRNPDTPVVSVIVPVYNQAQFLRETTANLDAQTWPAVEIIWIDDGSTDGSGALLDELVGRRDRVIHQDNAGLPATRNAGLLAATGDFVQLLDADDLLSDNKLAHHAAWLVDHPDVNIVSCEASYFRGSLRCQRPADSVQPFDDLPAALLGMNRFPVHAPMIRRAVTSRIGLFDESLPACEDWDYWLRCAAAGLRFDFVPGARAFYRLHGRQMSADPVRMLTGADAVLERIRRIAEQRGDRPEDLFAMLVSHTTWGLRAQAAGLEDISVALLYRLTDWPERLPQGLEHPEFTAAEHLELWTRVLLCLAGDTARRARAVCEWRIAAERIHRDPTAAGIRALLGAQRALECSSLRERLNEIASEAEWLSQKLHAERARPTVHPEPHGHVNETLDRMRDDGARRVVLYGAGEHTRWLLTEFDPGPLETVGIADDDEALWGGKILGIDVMSPRAAVDLCPDAVLISSDQWDAELAARAARLIPNASIYRLYDDNRVLPIGA